MKNKKRYLLQTRYGNGEVYPSMERAEDIVTLYGPNIAFDPVAQRALRLANPEYAIFDVSEMGVVKPIRHVAPTEAPFNFHRFVNVSGDTEFEGFSSVKAYYFIIRSRKHDRTGKEYTRWAYSDEFPSKEALRKYFSNCGKTVKANEIYTWEQVTDGRFSESAIKHISEDILRYQPELKNASHN